MGTKTTVPSFSEKRELLYAERPDPAALTARGRALLEAGLTDAALEMFAKAGDTAGLGEVLEAARRAGDAFSFEAALKALGRTATPAEWVSVGETALAAGLLWFSYRAFEKADHQEGLERVRQQMHAAGITFAEGR